VLDSHLHFDHAGGNTSVDHQGNVVPSFPNARYVVQRGELEFARSDNERIRASYIRDNFEPVGRARASRLRSTATPRGQAHRVQVAPGHTPFMHVP
jgi:glyoxylase-like metal-dependent hydrolase (beta-lactamase superfamily II)